MRLSLLQMTSGIDPLGNAATVERAVADAARTGADILFTPEMTGLLDRDRSRADAHIVAEDADLVLARARAAAHARAIWVHLGSIAVRGPDDRFRNRSILIDPSGAVRARYDKLHLFDVDLADGTSWRESTSYAPGDAAVVAHASDAAIGMSICYDLRFPDLYRALSDAGAAILAVPAAFTRPTGEAHWHALLRARAIEAGAFVVAAAQTGTHPDGRVTYGHSLVVGPWGDVLLDMGEQAGVATIDIDLAEIARVRAHIPALRHRRPIPPVLHAR